MSSFRWRNVPIPEGHILFLVVGVAIHMRFPRSLFRGRWPKHGFGWPLLLSGICLAVWAVLAVRDRDISQPTEVIDSGSYRFSRNPMYVGWTLIYLGAAALVNTWWLLILLPVLVAFTHYFVIRREEQQLEARFGEAYRQYRNRVRRYF